MEVSGEAIRAVEFREKLRGYHPDDVDAFVEEVATIVDQLLVRFHQVESGRPQTAPSSAEAEEAARRTLVAAQRTADELLAEAEATAARFKAEAEAEAARSVAAGSHTVDQHLAGLEADRARLVEEISQLGRQLEGHRAGFRQLLLEQLALIEGAPEAANVSRGDRIRFTDEGQDAFVEQLRRAVQPPPDDAAQPLTPEAPLVWNEPPRGGPLAEGTHASSAPTSPQQAPAWDEPDLPDLPTPWDQDAHDQEGLRDFPEGGRLSGRLFRRD